MKPKKVTQRIPVLVLLGFLSFALSCAAVRWLADSIEARSPRVDVMTDKLQWYREHKEDFDVIFIGTSRVLYNVLPKEFDRRLKQGGAPLRSFNFGIYQAGIIEEQQLVDAILAAGSKRLKYVIIEPQNKLEYWKDASARIVQASTFRVISGILGAAWASEFTPLEKLKISSDYIRLGLSRAVNLTLLSDIFNRTILETGDPKGFYLGPESDGYVPIDAGKANASLREVHDEFLRHTRDYLDLVKESAEPRCGNKQGTFEFYYTTRLAKQLKENGLKVVYLLPPVPFYGLRALFSCLPGLSTDPVIALDDPGKFPSLYSPDHRYDFNHMTPEESVEGSTILADQFLRLLLAKH
jgi:hypothetical protein